MNRFKARIRNRLAVTSGRIRYELFTPRLKENDVRERLIPELRRELPEGRDFWKALYAAYVDSCPSEIRSYDPSMFKERESEIRDALKGMMNVLGRTICIPEEHDWHTELFFGKKWARKYYRAISDYNPGTDIVLFWFENRLLHLLNLSYGYAVTKEESFAEEWLKHVLSWCRQNPCCVGMNWRSPMEIGIRLYVISLGLKELAGSGHIDSDKLEVIIESTILQAEHLSKNLSYWGGKANNHLIADAATLYAFASMWKILSSSSGWMKIGEEVLIKEIRRQVFRDGIHFENAVNYLACVLDFYLLHMLFLIKNGRDVAPDVGDGVKRMARAMMSLISPSGRLPRFGDDVTREFFILQDSDKTEGREMSDPIVFSRLLKHEYIGAYESVPWGEELVGLRVPFELDTVFPYGGYAVVRERDCHLVHSAGIQHDSEISDGHIHADLGAFELELLGRMIFMNSGTYLYKYDPEIRDYFRNSRAHNTLIIDGKELMEPGHTFEWRRAQRGEMLQLVTGDNGKVVCSRHRILNSPEEEFLHSRMIAKLNRSAWLIVDHVEKIRKNHAHSQNIHSDSQIRGAVDSEEEGVHRAEVFFHTPFDPTDCRLAENGVEIDIARGKNAHGTRRQENRDIENGLLEFSGAGSGEYKMEIVEDSDNRLTWYSPRYGELKFGTTIVGNIAFRDSVSLCQTLCPVDGYLGKPLIDCEADRVKVSFTGVQENWEFHFEPLRIIRNGAALGSSPAEHNAFSE